MFRTIIAMVFAGVLVGAAWLPSPALAADVDPMCIKDAVAAKKDCQARCKDDFLLTKDNCRNVAHGCADACRAGRSTCYDGPLAAVEACLAQCATDLEAAKTACRNQEPPLDEAALDQCIDAAQVAGFVCRDTCREGLDRTTLKLCRKAFRDCITACPPAPAN